MRGAEGAGVRLVVRTKNLPKFVGSVKPRRRLVAEFAEKVLVGHPKEL